MKTFHRDNQGGAKPWGKKVGDDRGPRKFGFGSRGVAHTAMHDATCAECNSPCQVPFRPNGRKPVLCGNCFKKDESGERQRYSNRPSTSRPAFGDRCPASKPFERTSQIDTHAIEARLAAIEARLDEILSRTA